MKIIKKTSNVYSIQKEGRKHVLYRRLREYDDHEQAIDDLLKLLRKEITEEELQRTEEV